MKTLAEWLREDDPLACDPGLSEAEAEAIRRLAVSEAIGAPRRQKIVSRDAWAIAAALMLLVALGVTTGRHLPAPPVPSSRVDDGTGQPGERRQLQFATPGGTRIIWTFDSEFTLKESVR